MAQTRADRKALLPIVGGFAIALFLLPVASAGPGPTTTRISVATGEANGISMSNAISADGRFVAFQCSASNLVAGDTNDIWDVFVHDSLSGATSESVSTASGAGEQRQFGSRPDRDGRYVAFEATRRTCRGGHERLDRRLRPRPPNRGNDRVSVGVGGAQAGHQP